MLLHPNKKKFLKIRRYKDHCFFETKDTSIKYGFFAIQSLEKGLLTAKQIEAVRRTITNFLKRKGKLWIRVFPNLPITKKPNEVRMGKGKGNIAFWSCYIKPGKILYELAGPNHKLLQQALLFAKIKIPFKTCILKKKA